MLKIVMNDTKKNDDCCADVTSRVESRGLMLDASFECGMMNRCLGVDGIRRVSH